MGLQIAAAKTRASLREPAKCPTVGESYSDVVIRVARGWPAAFCSRYPQRYPAHPCSARGMRRKRLNPLIFLH
jgi:hypothetical protein